MDMPRLTIMSINTACPAFTPQLPLPSFRAAPGRHHRYYDAQQRQQQRPAAVRRTHPARAVAHLHTTNISSVPDVVSTAEVNAGGGVTTTPDEEEVARLRAVYKQAKAAYKAFRKQVKDQHPDADGGDACATDGSAAELAQLAQLAQLEQAYRTSKTAYKTAKEEVKNNGMMARVMSKAGATTTTTTTTEATASAGPDTIQVCGAERCAKLGAHAVAEMLLGRGAQPNSGCLKKCGGVGPTVAIGGVVAKVNLKSAVADAVAKVQTGNVPETRRL